MAVELSLGGPCAEQENRPDDCLVGLNIFRSIDSSQGQDFHRGQQQLLAEKESNRLDD
jgi:hypothetical protein